MTELEYQQWWQYHIRVARGESLSDEETAIYQAGIEELDREEAAVLPRTSPATLRQLRNQIHLTTLRLNRPQLVRSRLSRQLQQML